MRIPQICVNCWSTLHTLKVNVLVEILGTLRSKDATATRTSLKKVHLRSVSLYRDYSYPITLLNVGEPS